MTHPLDPGWSTMQHAATGGTMANARRECQAPSGNWKWRRAIVYPMTNVEAATTFRLVADLLAIQGESVYKVGAYRRAAESIETLGESLIAIRGRNALLEIPGVGSEIAHKIEVLLDTGTIPLLARVETVVPRGVAALLAVPSVGPKRARALYETLGITSLDDLRTALAEHRLAAACIGPRQAARIADGLRSLQTLDTRLPLGRARAIGLDVIQALRSQAPAIRQIELAGS